MQVCEKRFNVAINFNTKMKQNSTRLLELTLIIILQYFVAVCSISLTQAPTDKSVFLNDNVEFNCKISNDEGHKLVWLINYNHNGLESYEAELTAPIDHEEDGHGLYNLAHSIETDPLSGALIHNLTLRIYGVQLIDEGNYSCGYEGNVFLSTSSPFSSWKKRFPLGTSATLSVLVPPNVLDPTLKPQTTAGTIQKRTANSTESVKNSNKAETGVIIPIAAAVGGSLTTIVITLIVYRCYNCVKQRQQTQSDDYVINQIPDTAPPGAARIVATMNSDHAYETPNGEHPTLPESIETRANETPQESNHLIYETSIDDQSALRNIGTLAHPTQQSPSVYSINIDGYISDNSYVELDQTDVSQHQYE